uniref:Uncharacterized protein n=1 Tax=Myotis myotis TaxID=51298 RepID=A0A7J7Z6D8_MYOMY|nr:hypothetical protein mMyoMyo1_010638 [Myotis myotis]
MLDKARSGMTLEKVRPLQHGPAAVQRPWQYGSCCGCICGHFCSKDHEGSCFHSLFVHKVSPQKDARSTLLSRKKPATSTNPVSQCGARVSGCLQQPDGCATRCTWMRTALLAPGQLEHWYVRQGQEMHLWLFSGGYLALVDCTNKLKSNKEYLEVSKGVEPDAAQVQLLE